MSAEMIERVARAICKSRSCQGVMCCEWPANMGRRSTCPVKMGGYRDAARDAIAALLEPTEGQLFAAHKTTGGVLLVGESREIWRSMIAAALADDTP